MSQQDYYFKQTGGSVNTPYRMFNPEAIPFQPCAGCGKPKRPQNGGGINMPYRYFNPNATPFQPCAGCGKPPAPPAVYANDFMRSQGCHDYNSCNMTSGNCQGCKSGACGKGCGLNCGCSPALPKQKGGNPTGAPLFLFNKGTNELKYNYNLEENFSGLPVFDRVNK